MENLNDPDNITKAFDVIKALLRSKDKLPDHLKILVDNIEAYTKLQSADTSMPTIQHNIR